MRKNTTDPEAGLKPLSQHFARWGIVLFLLIEFLDEFVYGAREAALPLIRDELRLSYVQVGLLLSLPGLVSALLEPIIGIVADSGHRERRTTALILDGGVFYALSLALTGGSKNFGWLLVSYVIFYPASGSFVSLSQGRLMDVQPLERERNMARWNFSGSAGMLLGAFAISVMLSQDVSWRWLFHASAALTAVLLISVRRDSGSANPAEVTGLDFWQSIRQALGHLRRWQIARWLVFLQVSDLILAVFVSYTSLFFVDVLSTTPEFAAVTVMVATATGLVGNFLVIRVLDQVPGLRLMRYTAWLQLLFLPLFLLVRVLWVNLALLILITLFSAGWYPILKAQLYEALPNQGGTVMALNNIGGLFGALIPWLIGMLAGRWGLASSLWVLLFAPVLFVVALPRQEPA